MDTVDVNSRIRTLSEALTKAVGKMVKSLNVKAFDTVGVKATYKVVVMKHNDKNDSSQLVPCIVIKVKRGEQKG